MDRVDRAESRVGTVVRVRLVGDRAQTELVELTKWLSREDTLRGRVSVRQPEVMPDEMGSVADVLEVVLGAQGMGTVLAASLAVWIKHRRPSADVEITGPRGHSVKISLRDVTDQNVEELLRRALED